VEGVDHCTYLSKGDKTDCGNYSHKTFVKYVQTFIRHSAVRLPHMQRTLLGIINVDFDATDQLLIMYSIFVNS